MIQLNREVLYLSRADVQRVGLPMRECIDILERAFTIKGSGSVDLPAKSEICSRPGDFLHAMPCYIGGDADQCGIKWLGGYYGNPGRGLPFITGLIVLNDAATGVPIAIMDCTEITALRTAAATGLALRKLANRDARTAAIIGCGRQGRSDLDALLAECPQVQSVVAWGPNAPTVERYCAETSARHGREIRRVDTVRAAVEGIDLLVIAGPGVKSDRQRVIEPQWIKPGATIATVNLDCHLQRGVVAAVVDKVYTDDVEMFRLMQRDGLFDGIATPPPELGDLLTGKAPGRERHDEVILSMPVGIGMDDVVTAHRVLQRARQMGVGTVLPL